ncbi:MAG TPA: hypothetical protein VEK78_06230 [Gemmatimonadales bacterium]|nr:hypothetical protein [Gemmatimonadales bacterium]
MKRSCVHRLARLVPLLGLPACHVGTRADKFPLAQRPEGVEVKVAVRGAPRVTGELLAVEDTALLILRERRVVLVPARSIRDVRLRGLPDFLPLGVGRDGRFEQDDALRHTRLVSRFPQGLAPPLMQALLSAYAQTAVDVVAP